MTQLSESLIGGVGVVSTPAMKPSTNSSPSSSSHHLPFNLPKLENFRVAVLILHALNQFINGVNNLDHVDSQVEEQTEEADVAGRYYCYQCCHMVGVTAADVEIKCPVCQGGCIEECGGVSSLCLTKPSEHEHSASDSDGHSVAIVQPPLDQIVMDIMEDTYGSQNATIYGVSNLSQSLLASSNSNADIGTDMPGHVISYDSISIEASLPLNIGTNMSSEASDQPQLGTRKTSCVWIVILATGLGLEAVSVYLDQVASLKKPYYAFYGMVFSIVAALVCIFDLIRNVIKLRGASADDMFWGTLPEVFGTILAGIQCINSALQYSFLCRQAQYPVKVSLVPILCFFILFAFKYKMGERIRS